MRRTILFVLNRNTAPLLLVGIFFATGCMTSTGLVEQVDGSPDSDSSTTTDTQSDSDTGPAPTVLEVPFKEGPTHPHDLKQSCAVSAESTESSETCPTIQWNGITYWAFSFDNNDDAMGIVAYDSNGQVVHRIDEEGARYVWDITIDYAQETVTLHGQAENTITMDWSDLEIPGDSVDYTDWLCNSAYFGWNDDCDCGCGVPDPDCSGGGCTPPDCYDASCDYCWSKSGEAIPCEKKNVF